MALTGTETLYVLGQNPTNVPAAATFQTTTAQIAQLASSGSTSMSITALNTVGAGTITAAGIVGKITSRGGTQVAVFTDTTDTAANIVTALSVQTVGVSFKYTYINNTTVTATLTGGTGVTVSGITVVPPASWVEYLVTYSAANTVTMAAIESGQNAILPPSQFSTNTTTSTFAAGQLTGADFVVYANTGNAPGTINTRTAAQMIADIPNAYVGQTWVVRIYHGGTGTLTVGAGSNVTITGTATIATTTWRDFLCTVATASTVTMQNIGSGTA